MFDAKEVIGTVMNIFQMNIFPFIKYKEILKLILFSLIKKKSKNVNEKFGKKSKNYCIFRLFMF